MGNEANLEITNDEGSEEEKYWYYPFGGHHPGSECAARCEQCLEIYGQGAGQGDGTGLF